MALLVKSQTVADEASLEVEFTETTGTYNATTNPTGYGASQIPAGTREITDILSSNLAILPLNGTYGYSGSATPDTEDLLYSVEYDNTSAQSIAGGTPITLDLGDLIGDDYIDAVYKLIYHNWFIGADVVTQGTSSNLLNVSDYNDFTNAKYIKLIIDTVDYIYEILAVNTNNTIQINGETALDGDISYEVAYESISYFDNIYYINKCIHSKVAKIACSECSCDDKKKEKIFENLFQLFGIQTNMDRENYSCANEIISGITIYCSSNGCC